MEPEGTKEVDTYRLSAATTDADEVKIDVQKGFFAKDISGPLYSGNTPISAATPKPL